MANFGCQVYAFDPSMGKGDHEHSEKVMFYNQALSDVNQERNTSVSDQLNKGAWKSRTLATTIMELGHFEVIFKEHVFFNINIINLLTSRHVRLHVSHFVGEMYGQLIKMIQVGVELNVRGRKTNITKIKPLIS